MHSYVLCYFIILLDYPLQTDMKNTDIMLENINMFTTFKSNSFFAFKGARTSHLCKI